MTHGLLILATVAGIATSPPPATLRNVAPASHAGADVLLRAAFTVADDYWRARGRAIPCPVDLYVYDADDDSEMRGALGRCIVWVDRRYRNDSWELVSDRRAPRRLRLDELEALCAGAVHERGHNLGLPDVPSPSRSIMQRESALRVIPATCWRWAARFLPRHR